MPTILAIETSCDETAAAVVQKNSSDFVVLANVVQSQASLHAKWGGVVPDLASREHIKNISPVIEEALLRSGCSVASLDAIAVTHGPGLSPALVVGVNAAKTLSLLWQKPLLPIHHLEGHIYANLLSPANKIIFPLLALIVSGGHTQLVLMKKDFSYTLLGETLDDAVGEAFDKVAKILGLPYPGGPIIETLATTFEQNSTPEELLVFCNLFPRPMIDASNYNFSFSGLKTAVLYFIQNKEKETPGISTTPLFQQGVAFAFQTAALEVLLHKTKKALQEYLPKTLVIAGGVSANQKLRTLCENLIKTDFPETRFLQPEFLYSLDNAAMIGAAAVLRFETLSEEEKLHLLQNVALLEPKANLSLSAHN